MKMPSRMLPFTFFTISTPMISTPIRANRAVMPWLRKVPFFKEPLMEKMVTRVESEFTVSFAFCRPMKAMNRPMPALTAFFRHMGMALKMPSRTLVSDSAMKIRPSINTAASAISQL